MKHNMYGPDAMGNPSYQYPIGYYPFAPQPITTVDGTYWLYPTYAHHGHVMDHVGANNHHVMVDHVGSYKNSHVVDHVDGKNHRSHVTDHKGAVNHDNHVTEPAVAITNKNSHVTDHETTSHHIQTEPMPGARLQVADSGGERQKQQRCVNLCSDWCNRHLTTSPGCYDTRDDDVDSVLSSRSSSRLVKWG